MLRTHTCGELNKEHKDKKVTLCGWIDNLKNLGKVGFINLRDRYGITQIFVPGELLDKLKGLRRESVMKITGKVNVRPNANKKLKTGEIEVQAQDIVVLSLAEPLPLEIGDDKAGEDIRLKYRYLDLRQEKLQKNMELRHKAIFFIRKFLDERGFYEITTPILTVSSPEGARDYLVPSRIHKGKFYALPQSPQQYKQLLMVAGFDRYFQIAPCFRDEDARAHRCPGEFYQLDLEMSFVTQDDILNITEELMIKMVKEVFPDKKLTFKKFPRLNYHDVMKEHKTDCPDLRKNKEDKEELAFCWVINFPLFTEQSEEDYFHGAGDKLAPSHHMFTMPREEDIPLLDTDPKKAKAYQHDLILNGYEVGGGSVRIHNAKIQEKIFDLIGFSAEQKQVFQHMLTAFKYGVPPHGGIAPGIDRLLMVILGEKSIREAVAFPKNKEAKDLTMGAPSKVSEEQLEELGIFHYME